MWLFHSATFFWGVMWPYHYSVTRTTGRIKYFHIIVTLISIVLPTIVVISIQFNGGYGLNVITPQKCDTRRAENILFGLLLPLDLIVITKVALLLITGWKIADIVSSNMVCGGSVYIAVNINFVP